MALRRSKSRQKTEHSFVLFQHRMLKDPAFQRLSGRACKVLFFLAGQYKGKNNGDLTIAWKIAREAGFRSNGNLRVAVQELIEAGFVVLTRQGGRNRCSLFALAWFPINECGGKLDVSASPVAPNCWLWNGRLSEPPTAQPNTSGSSIEGKEAVSPPTNEPPGVQSTVIRPAD